MKRQIGHRLQILRKARKMTQKELAEGICSPGKISRYENDVDPIPESLFPILAQRLDVSIDYLTGESEAIQIQEIEQQADQLYRLIHRKEYASAWEQLQQIKAASQGILNEEVRINIINLEATYYARKKKNEEAYTILKELSAYRFAQYTHLFFRIQITLGILQYNQGKYIDALDHLSQAMERKERDDSIHEAILYHYLALTYSRIQINPQATYYAKRAAHLFQQQHALFNLKEAALLRSIIYYSEKRWNESLEQSQFVLQSPYETTQEKYQHAKALHNIGIVLKEQQRWEESLHYLTQSIALKQELHDFAEIGFTLLITCLVYLGMEEYDLFQQTVQQLEEEYHEHLLPIHQALVHQVKGEYYNQMTKYREMQHEYLRAIHIFQAAGAPNYAARLYFILAEHFNSRDYYAESARLYHGYFVNNIYDI